MIKAVIFDMDGTAIDSMMSYEATVGTLLEKLGIDTSTKEAQELMALKWFITGDAINEVYGTDFCNKAIKDGYTETHYAKYKNEFEVTKGFVRFLDYLDTQGIKYGIATATRIQGVEDQFKRLNLYDRFSTVITEGIMGKTKQKPDIYLNAAHDMGADETNTIVFEDALYAIQTTTEAGFKTIALKEDFFKEDLQEIEELADLVIDDFDQLMDMIENNEYTL